ncbi:aquaporin-like [Anopheles ziemanni]|uniref:aquaporin-like n=1 Tax=Anopheles coustani TaxID=139045 RepID=UPI00265A5397|nr:aquaporin-like [Anopheles coustani]XP_058169948.1 aquaporin-like [Anopheles ziemanni]
MAHNELPKEQQQQGNDGENPPIGMSHPGKPVLTNNPAYDAFAKFLGEFFGTAILLFLGCMGCLDAFDNVTSTFSRGLIFGFVVMVAIVTFGVVSGAHINPSVSIAAYIYGDLSFVMLLLYFVAQFTGALCGYGLLMGVAPQVYFDEALVGGHGSCVTAPHASLTVGSALAIEFIVTGILVWTCCGVWDPRNAQHQDSVPIKFGLLVGTIAVAAGPATGGSMNPARTLAPCVWNNSYHEIWIYFVGPSLAAVIMPIVYKFVFRKEV